MKQIGKVLLGCAVVGLGMMALESCTKESGVPQPDPVQVAPIADSTLYRLAYTYDGFTWYKFSDSILDRSSGSGHNPPLFRTRFNTIAAAQLDSSGKVAVGAVFPNGSYIVKELHQTQYLDRFAVMYKKTDDPNADRNGWLWGYINPNGTIAYSVKEKGGQCTNCHSQSGNIDAVLMNKFYP